MASSKGTSVPGTPHPACVQRMASESASVSSRVPARSLQSGAMVWAAIR